MNKKQVTNSAKNRKIEKQFENKLLPSNSSKIDCYPVKTQNRFICCNRGKNSKKGTSIVNFS